MGTQLLLLLLLLFLLLLLLTMTQLRAQLLVRNHLLLQSLHFLFCFEVGLAHGLDLGVVPVLDFLEFFAFCAVVTWCEEKW